MSLLVAVSAAFAMTPSAWAAAPSNDNRVDATLVDPPQSLTGTLVEATLEPTNDTSLCGCHRRRRSGTTSPRRRAVRSSIQLDAAGEMDATVDLFKSVRSKLDVRRLQRHRLRRERRPSTATGWTVGANYAIRVGNQTGSVADTFKLRVLVPKAPPDAAGSPPARPRASATTWTGS